MSHGGHLFVVHGKIEHLVHDAAIVPVDRRLDFNPIWRPLLGASWPVAPATWEEGWGRVHDRDQWLVEVGDGDYDLVLRRVSTALRDIAGQGLQPAGGRTYPLVALPVLGVGLGGHAHEPGTVVKKLISHLTGLSDELGIDVALVTPEPSVYAAAQFARKQGTGPLGDGGEEAAKELGDKARSDNLALFLGAGVSIPAGLMSWEKLIEHLAAAEPSLAGADLNRLSTTDQAELIERADNKRFKGRVADLIRPSVRPGLLHTLLAGLDVKQVVTTNYDVLYETAVKAAGRTITSVMPWSSALGAERWVLKLHGDVDHEDMIVLTRRHMVRYDAANRPSAAILQSLLLTKHLLVVGASLTDDNVVRLAHEVQAYRDEHQKSSPHDAYGTVLDASPKGDRLRSRLWGGQLDWMHLADLPGGSSYRALELLLDRVGVHASRNAPWLLDPRFVGLLDSNQDRAIAEKARALHSELIGTSGETWHPLQESLEQLGARHV